MFDGFIRDLDLSALDESARSRMAQARDAALLEAARAEAAIAAAERTAAAVTAAFADAAATAATTLAAANAFGAAATARAEAAEAARDRVLAEAAAAAELSVRLDTALSQGSATGPGCSAPRHAARALHRETVHLGHSVEHFRSQLAQESERAAALAAELAAARAALLDAENAAESAAELARQMADAAKEYASRSHPEPIEGSMPGDHSSAEAMARLEAELAQARSWIAAFEASTSWKAMAAARGISSLGRWTMVRTLEVAARASPVKRGLLLSRYVAPSTFRWAEKLYLRQRAARNADRLGPAELLVSQRPDALAPPHRREDRDATAEQVPASNGTAGNGPTKS